MSKINIAQMYRDRFTQINEDLKQEYKKGKRKNLSKIAKLLQEKTRLGKLID